jgi:hypothetical protein
MLCSIIGSHPDLLCSLMTPFKRYFQFLQSKLPSAIPFIPKLFVVVLFCISIITPQKASLSKPTY